MSCNGLGQGQSGAWHGVAVAVSLWNIKRDVMNTRRDVQWPLSATPTSACGLSNNFSAGLRRGARRRF
jgi:hypothetical protein